MTVLGAVFFYWQSRREERVESRRGKKIFV
jgi:hypothetical protein